jgi:NAD(P)H dehydrogenase (quinone)
MTTSIALTGVTGGIGGRVARLLETAGVAPRLVVRDRARAPQISGADVTTGDYADGEAMRRALDGAGTLLLVSAGEAADRVVQHRTAVDAAVAAGVERIVYISFLGASPTCTFTFGRDHFHTEQHIAATGIRHTFLRDSIYQDLLPAFVGAGDAIRAPAGDGRVSAVARDDIADVATAVLLDQAESHDGRTYDVTGPEALTVAEIAAVLSDAVGRPITYVPETVEVAYASRATHGAPPWEVDGWVTSYTAIAAGELATVSDTVPSVAGHPATPLAENLARHPELTAPLRRV